MRFVYSLAVLLVSVAIPVANSLSCKIQSTTTATTATVFTDTGAPCHGNTAVTGYIAQQTAWVMLTNTDSSSAADTCQDLYLELQAVNQACFDAINTTITADAPISTDDDNCVNVALQCGAQPTCACSKGEVCQSLANSICAAGSCLKSPWEMNETCQVQAPITLFCTSTLTSALDPFATGAVCDSETIDGASHATNFESAPAKVFYSLTVQANEDSPPTCTNALTALTSTTCADALQTVAASTTAEQACVTGGQGTNTSCPLPTGSACVDGNVCSGTEQCIDIGGSKQCAQAALTGQYKFRFMSGNFSRILDSQYFLDFTTTAADCSAYTFAGTQYHSQYRFFTATGPGGLSSECVTALQTANDIIITEQNGLDDQKCSTTCGFPACKCLYGGTCTRWWLSESARFCEDYHECVEEKTPEGVPKGVFTCSASLLTVKLVMAIIAFSTLIFMM